MSPLVLVNVGFAVVVAVVAVRWWQARQAAGGGTGTVSLRVQVQALDEEEAQRVVVAAADGAEVAPPVIGDRALRVDVPTERADTVLADLLAGFLGDGYEVSRESPRRVVLRRGPDRVTVTAAPGG